MYELCYRAIPSRIQVASIEFIRVQRISIMNQITFTCEETVDNPYEERVQQSRTPFSAVPVTGARCHRISWKLASGARPTKFAE